jgi:hypothetical protein
MRRSLQVTAPILASTALTLLAGCRSPQMQRCVDESNHVVDDSFCQTGNNPPNPNLPHFRYYYGGYGGYYPGSIASGGGYAPISGTSYSTTSGTSRGGFGSTHGGSGGGGEGGGGGGE